MRIIRAGYGGLVTLAALLSVAPLQAWAHPHAYFWTTVEPHFNDAGELVAVGERWDFDLDYSELVTPQLDADHDGAFTAADLDAVMSTGILSWIPTSGYFTRITVNGQPLAHGPAQDTAVTLVNGGLRVSFVLTLAEPQPVSAGTVGIDVFDKEFYYDISFARGGIIAPDVPAGCNAGPRGAVPLDPVAIELLRRLNLPMDAALASDPAAGYAVRVVIVCG